MCEVGFLHLIHQKTTISPVIRNKPERQRGSSEVAPSRNGKHPARAPFYGFTGNVGYLIVTRSQALMVSLPDSWSWKKRFLVC